MAYVYDAIRVKSLNRNTYVVLGQYGENEARTLQFDVTEWANAFSGATYTIVVQLPGDSGECYTATTSTVTEDDATIVQWTVTNSDTSVVGKGYAEIRATVGDVLCKSAVFSTEVKPALGESGEYPDPAKDWVQSILDAATTATEAATTATEAATAASTSATAAAASEAAAAESATNAAASATEAATSAASVTASAEQIATNTADIATLKTEVDALAQYVGSTEQPAWSEVKKLVNAGLASAMFPVGYQFTVKHDVFGDLKCTVMDTTDGLWLLADDAPLGSYWDEAECLYYAADGLTAGTYCFTWGTQMYEFTTTTDIPAGGWVGCMTSWNGDAINSMYTYGDRDSNTELEKALTVSKVDSSEGTNIGTVGVELNTQPGYCGRSGCTVWASSNVRQWLNSDAETAGAWFVRRDDFDRCISSNTLKYGGFLYGLDADLLAVLSDQTNTEGGETTTDKVTLANDWLLTESQFVTDGGSLVHYADGTAVVWWGMHCVRVTAVRHVKSTGALGTMYTNYVWDSNTRLFPVFYIGKDE